MDKKCPQIVGYYLGAFLFLIWYLQHAGAFHFFVAQIYPRLL